MRRILLFHQHLIIYLISRLYNFVAADQIFVTIVKYLGRNRYVAAWILLQENSSGEIPSLPIVHWYKTTCYSNCYLKERIYYHFPTCESGACSSAST